MLTVAMVYRSGGDFDERYVIRLAEEIDDAITSPCWTVCLTDRPSPALERAVDGVRPLQHGWPGWWSKMELFSLDGPVLYFDLDTMIVGDIAPLVQAVEALSSDQIIMLRGFYQKDQCSGIMGWSGNFTWLYDAFVQLLEQRGAAKAPPIDPVGAMASRVGFRGDQEYIRAKLRQRQQLQVILVQDVISGIYSYKVHVRERGRIPDDASIICFHGKPRPHEVTLPRGRKVTA